MTCWEKLEFHVGERTIVFVPDQIWEEDPDGELYRCAAAETDRVIERKADTAFLLLSGQGQETGAEMRAAAEAIFLGLPMESTTTTASTSMASTEAGKLGKGTRQSVTTTTWSAYLASVMA